MIDMTTARSRKKGGRPPSPNPLCECLTVRLTAAEMRRFRALAARDSRGETPSGLVRALILSELERSRRRA